MSELLDNPNIRRLVCNRLAAQKRWEVREALTVETAEGVAMGFHPDMLKRAYCSGALELDEFELLLGYALGVSRR